MVRGKALANNFRTYNCWNEGKPKVKVAT